MSGPFDPAPRQPGPTGPDDDLRTRRQRGRATVMALLLGGLVVLIFAITISKIRMGMHH